MRSEDRMSERPVSNSGEKGDTGFANKRMYRIFRGDGRSLVVAIDHGMGLDIYPELVEPDRVLEQVAEGGADAVLITPGLMKRYFHCLKSIGVILRVDGGSSALEGGSTAHKLLYSVEDALRLGADAVACMGFPGSPFETETIENLASLAGQCQNWNVPLMAEMIPGGFASPGRHTIENIRLAVRMGIELGADFIKTKYVGPPERFRQVIEHAYRPVLVLGGEKTSDEKALFSMVRAALDAGASGIAMGRQVWKHPRPRSMVSALNHLIRNNGSVEEALDVLAADLIR